MKKKQQKLKWLTSEQVFGKLLKDKKLRKVYNEELARLRLAKQIRELRVARKMTQKAVAQKAGMQQSVIARIETGDRAISVETLGRVAHTLGKEVQLV